MKQGLQSWKHGSRSRLKRELPRSESQNHTLLELVKKNTNEQVKIAQSWAQVVADDLLTYATRIRDRLSSAKPCTHTAR